MVNMVSQPSDTTKPLSEVVRKCFEDEVLKARRALTSSRPSVASITSGYLATVIEHMTTTRSFFMDDARQFITLVLAPFFASGLVGANSFAEGIAPRDATILRGIALAIVFIILPVTYALESKAKAAYEFYVASAIHAAIMHSAVSLGGCHHWFAHVYRCIDGIVDKDKEGIDRFAASLHWKQVLINSWMRSSSQDSRGGGNLFQSFNLLLRISKGAAYAVLFLGLVFTCTHASSESAKSSPSHQTQSSATIQCKPL